MRKSVNAGILFTGIILLLTDCKKKNDQPPLSSNAFLYTFVLYASDNPSLGQDVHGRISNDTIYLNLKIGTDLTNLVPTITYSGASVNPSSRASQNFTNQIIYTVTAENGNKKSYKTQVGYLSNAKEITSFLLKKDQNPNLDSNIIATISGDSITINLTANVDIASLTPSITHTGSSILPSNQQASDFTFPTTYTVAAEDGSTRKYKVFVSYNRSVFINGDDGYLYAINAANGSVQWKYFTGAQAVPTYYNGAVYIAGANNVVYAVNAANGALKWTSAPPAGNYSLTIPSASNGKVYFAGAGFLNYPGSIYAHYVGFVYALNTETGNQEWMDTLFTNYPYSNSMITNVTVKDNIACVYDIMNGLFVYNATDGTELWGMIGDMLGRTNPVIQNNVIYYGIEGGLRALQTNNGQQNWMLVNNVVYSSPTISNNLLYTTDQHNLYAFDLLGNVKWQTSLDVNNTYGTPYVSNGAIYLLNSQEQLNAYSAQDGSLKWRKPSYAGQPIVANNEIYIYDVNKQLNCLDAATGNIKWVCAVQNNFSQPFFVLDGKWNSYHITDSGDQQ